jgi:hypothetical protein
MLWLDQTNPAGESNPARKRQPVASPKETRRGERERPVAPDELRRCAGAEGEGR